MFYLSGPLDTYLIACAVPSLYLIGISDVIVVIKFCRLEDKETEPTVIKLVDRAELMKEREQKLKQEEARRIEKEKKKAEAEAKAAKNKVPPWEMFKADTDKYSKFDDKFVFEM